MKQENWKGHRARLRATRQLRAEILVLAAAKGWSAEQVNEFIWAMFDRKLDQLSMRELTALHIHFSIPPKES